MDCQKIVEKYGAYQIEMRRYFHAHPEVSTKEYETAKRIREELTKWGIEWRPCGLETGTLATIQGRAPGKTILIRGDIDALTVQEETGVEYASCNPGVMHACGHDCHISMLLTAARILNDMRDEFVGTVKLAFQPAEETGQGAPAMIAEGALEGVDACFGMHVWSDVPSGQVSVQAGPRMAGTDMFKITVEGRGGHGAQPHHCIDATVTAAAIVANLQTLVSREISPVETAVVTVGTLHSGTRWNVVSGHAELTGTTRYFSPEIGKALPGMLERVVKSTAASFRAEATVENSVVVPPTVNEPGMTALAQGAVKKIFGENGLNEQPPTMGGEDFSNFMNRVPGCIALLGVRNAACNAVWGQHSNKYQVDEAALIKGAMLHAQVALDFLAK